MIWFYLIPLALLAIHWIGYSLYFKYGNPGTLELKDGMIVNTVVLYTMFIPLLNLLVCVFLIFAYVWIPIESYFKLDSKD